MAGLGRGRRLPCEASDERRRKISAKVSTTRVLRCEVARPYRRHQCAQLILESQTRTRPRQSTPSRDGVPRQAADPEDRIPHPA